jgi:hypothetical protein
LLKNTLAAAVMLPIPTSQVAATIGDVMLVEEGALRAYNLLAPLLQQQDISPLLHQALSTLHLALTEVKDTAPATLDGHTQQRIMAARASAAVSHWLLRLSAPISPVLAAGAVAGTAGGVSGKQLQPAGSFARLDHALLKALTRQVPDASSAVLEEPASRGAARQSVTGTASPAAGKPSKGASKQAKAEAEAAAAAAAAAEPELSLDEAAAAAEQLVEMTAAQDLLLLHPDGTAWASPSTSSR